MSKAKPSDQDPTVILRKADEVAVVEGSVTWGRPLYDRQRGDAEVLAREKDHQRVQALVDALAATPGREMDWMTPGGPTIVFLRNDEVLAEITLLPPDYVRSSLWDGDRELHDHACLMRWLAEHEVEPPPLG